MLSPGVLKVGFDYVLCVGVSFFVFIFGCSAYTDHLLFVLSELLVSIRLEQRYDFFNEICCSKKKKKSQ